MAVLRIVPNIQADRVEDARAFYRDVIGLEPVMDLGWIPAFAGVTVKALVDVLAHMD